MAQPAVTTRRASYADLEAVPPNKVAEIIHGSLQVFPRPGPAHAWASTALTGKLTVPFQFGGGGGGGWRIFDEPELHLGSDEGADVLVPDLAGWRIERLPKLPKTAYFTLPPDWVCEVLSPSTETVDRIEKMPIYAREGVRHVWLLHPIRRTLEVFFRNADGYWVLIGSHVGDAVVNAAPFEALDLELSSLWAEVEGEVSE